MFLSSQEQQEILEGEENGAGAGDGGNENAVETMDEESKKQQAMLNQKKWKTKSAMTRKCVSVTKTSRNLV